MTTHTDQIEEIKKAEEKAKKHLEDANSRALEDENEVKAKLATEIETRKTELQERKQQKLEIVTQEGEHIKTSKKTESEGHKNQLLSNAQSKQGEAIDYIITKFVEYIKA